MNTFKRKTLSAAVAAGLGAMALAGSAGAVQLSQDGTGSALVYPYYTVRTAGNGDYNTYVNVVNTTNSAKVVKVRFLEGKNSREVLDFNLWLSPQDVWAGVITPTADGANLASRDQSCVTRSGGVDASSGGTTTTAGAGFNFTNINFTTASRATADPLNLVGPDGGDTSLDRTREGYIEIIEMGVVSDPTLATAVTHNSAGIPNNCAAVPVVDTLADGTANSRISAGTGGLMGGATLINVNNGSDFGYDPVVLEDFATGQPLFRAPGDIEPTLNSATPVSNVFYYHPVGASFVTDVLTSGWAGGNAGALAVGAVIDRVSVMNNYVLDTATNSSTDWVLTFPTKRHFVVPASAAAATNSGSFANWSEFAAVAGSGACGTFSVTPYDREEQSPGAVVIDIPEISPLPVVPDTLPDQMCWESTVVNFHPEGTTPAATDTLLGSTNGRGVPVPYEHGWARLSFPATAAAADGGYTPVSSVAGTTYSGLPVVGFMVQDFLNPNVTIGGLPSASSYGGNFNHRFERVITGTGVSVP